MDLLETALVGQVSPSRDSGQVRAAVLVRSVFTCLYCLSFSPILLLVLLFFCFVMSAWAGPVFGVVEGLGLSFLIFIFNVPCPPIPTIAPVLPDYHTYKFR